MRAARSDIVALLLGSFWARDQPVLRAALLFRDKVSAKEHGISRSISTWRRRPVALISEVNLDGAGQRVVYDHRSDTDEFRASSILSNPDILSPVSKIRSHGIGLRQKSQRLGKAIFLPTGWPQSVPREYLQYQIVDVIQHLSTYLRGILSTQALLEGFGIGREGATAIGATIQWIIRDGASMLSSLTFSTLASTNFGVNAKMWRLFADFIVDVGITLEMVAPLLPQSFLFCICLASVFKALCGVAAGSASGAIFAHWGGKEATISEVLAKGGAQSTAVSLCGMIIGLWFTKAANGSLRMMWVAYIGLTVIHLLSNYAAMRILAFKTINRSRLDVILKTFLGQQVVSVSDGVPSLTQVARVERLIFAPWTGKQVRMGVQVSDLTKSTSDLENLMAIYRNEAYLLTVRKGRALIALHRNSTPETQLKAYMHAYIYRLSLRRQTTDDFAELERTLVNANNLWPALERGLREQGWEVNRPFLSAKGWRYSND